ncbi:hypothetical protein V5799_033078 [Amblyomma americanum]|uniref:Thioredoxin-like fold domain-containing protein n=1 Tax=Amblyomma americanum TaxID=6943 RepID=A0AAQ4DPC3_AMBAM
MELLRDKVLLTKDGTSIAAEVALRNKRIICIYFSAQWCEPCRTFTPMLADAYREVKQHGLPIEVYRKTKKKKRAEYLSIGAVATRKAANENPFSTQIVFVSQDRTQAEMQDDFHAHHGEWLTVPYGDNLQS